MANNSGSVVSTVAFLLITLAFPASSVAAIVIVCIPSPTLVKLGSVTATEVSVLNA